MLRVLAGRGELRLRLHMAAPHVYTNHDKCRHVCTTHLKTLKTEIMTNCHIMIMTTFFIATEKYLIQHKTLIVHCQWRDVSPCLGQVRESARSARA